MRFPRRGWRRDTHRRPARWQRSSPTCTTNRVSHLQRRAREHVGDLQSFPRGAQPGKRELRGTLRASENALARLFEDAEAAGKVKSFAGSPATYLGYFIAHEAHHRGLVLVSLRLSGTKLPKEITYGIWYWRKKLS